MFTVTKHSTGARRIARKIARGIDSQKEPRRTVSDPVSSSSLA